MMKIYKIKEMTEPEKAWLACALDGEGTVTLGFDRYRSKTNPKNSRLNGRIYPYIIICNTDARFVDRAVEITGFGKTAIRSTYYKDGRAFPYFRWEIQNYSQSRQVLEAVLPYLIIKRRHAEVVLEYVKLRQAKLGLTTCASKIPYGEEEGSLLAAVRQLNAR